MAIQILDDPSKYSRISTGLSQGLGRLAQSKSAELEKRTDRGRISQALQSLGFDSNQSKALGALDPSILKELVKAKAQEPNQQAFAQALQQVLGGPTQNPVEQQLEGLSAPQEGGPIGQINKPGQLSNTAGLTSDQSIKLAQLGIQQQQNASKEKADAYKYSKEYLTESRNQASQAKDDIRNLNAMDALNKSNGLPNTKIYTALKHLGLDYPVLLNPKGEAFEKLTVDFLAGAKNTFGSRVTNYDAQTYLKGIPTLLNTPEGRDNVIKTLKIIRQGKIEKQKAIDQILKENKNIPPYDLANRVEELIGPKLDNLSAQLVSLAQGNNDMSFDKLPPASGFAGKKIQDEETGQIYVSDGSSWKKV
jgi:hypothetical protein